MIMQQPTGPVGAIPPGTTHLFSVGVNTDATTPIQYQWYVNGIAVPSEVNSTFLYTATGSPDTVQVSIQNPCGQELSQAVLVESVPEVPCKVYDCEAMLVYWTDYNATDMYWPMIGQTSQTFGDGIFSQAYLDSGNTDNSKNIVSPPALFEDFFPNGSFPTTAGENPEFCDNYGPTNIGPLTLSDPANYRLEKAITAAERSSFETGLGTDTGTVSIGFGGAWAPIDEAGALIVMLLNTESFRHEPNGYDWLPNSNPLGNYIGAEIAQGPLDGSVRTFEIRPYLKNINVGAQTPIIAREDDPMKPFYVQVDLREGLVNGFQDYDQRVQIWFGDDYVDSGWQSRGGGTTAEGTGEYEYRFTNGEALNSFEFRGRQKVAHWGISNTPSQAEVDAMYDAYDRSLFSYVDPDPNCTP
jgi:hypothetical protein